MTQARINAALEGRLANWAAARSPALPVLFPNTTQQAPPGTHLRAYVLPAATMSRTLGNEDRGYRGLFQVSIFLPTNLGTGLATQIADELGLLFPAGLRLDANGLGLTVLTPVSPGPALPEPVWYIVPTSFRYAAEDIV